MSQAYTDLVRLANSNGGKIPATVPAHYVQWAMAQRKAAKPVAKFTDNVARISAYVFNAPHGYDVTVRDDESLLSLPYAKPFPHDRQEDAIAYARKCANQ